MTGGYSRIFDFHGCVLEFRSGDLELADWFAADFSAFPAAPGARPEITITADILKTPPRGLPGALLRAGKWHILQSPPGRRLVWYPEGALCEYDYRARRGLVSSADRDLLKELSYLLILSRAGEALDRRGLHRLHAGALGSGGRALLFCGAQGAGKTTLLLELLKDRSFSLLSDDTPLVSRNGTVHHFPSRIGLGEDSPHLGDFPSLRSFKRRHYLPKRLLDIGVSGLEVSPPLAPSFIFALCRAGSPAFRRPAAGAAALELAKSLVAGCGVPQMAEYFLRLSPSDIARKGLILASRVKAAHALLRKTSFLVFETGPDHAANAAALKSFLRSGSAPA
ncbi:MAG: hypothetical protein Q8O90_03065 [Elusimicrobiota bacterium]|nr:hypothetical protein [Elusimicrobiota bacterium]